jgi:Reverse transcriptase (RNA-dependent DNA polymerase)
MPFGLTNVLILYQSLINNILRKYLDDFMIAYLNDILIYLKTKEKHIKHVTAVLKALEKADVRINDAKSVFHVQHINFLSYILTTDRIKMNLIKTVTIRDWPTPKNMTEIQEFMSFANFYRKFIRGYSGVSISLTDLIKKNKTFA